MIYSREQLIDICERAWVPQEHWYNRDSASAQMQLGQAYALLKAGCDFTFDPSVGGDPEHTIWVRIAYRGFSWFEGGLDYDEPQDNYLSEDLFYLPTDKRLAANTDGDWY